MQGTRAYAYGGSPLSFSTFSPRRSGAVATLYLIGVLDAITPNVVTAIATHGFWDAAFDTFGVSALAVMATLAGLRLARQAKTPWGKADKMAFAAFFALLLIPHRIFGWLALSWLALFEGVRGWRDPFARGAACLFGLIAVAACWAMALLQAYPFCLKFDAWLAGSLLRLVRGGGVRVIGNVLITSDQDSIAVLPGCSFLPLVASAALCFVAVRFSIHPGWTKRDTLILTGLAGFVLVFNAIRIALMGYNDIWFQNIHGPAGASLFDATVLLAAVTAGVFAAGAHGDRRLHPWRSASRHSAEL